MRFLSFDIETAGKAPPSHTDSYQIGVTVAATAMYDGPGGPKTYLWHGPGVFDWTQNKQVYAPRMEPGEIAELLAYLWSARQSGAQIVTINGTGFDYRVLAEESRSPEMHRLAAELALDSIDPPFQFFCEEGWMIGMAKMAAYLGLSKTEGMDGVAAIDAWVSGDPEQQGSVLEYVEQDALVTGEIYREALKNGHVGWVASTGNKKTWLPRWRIDGEIVTPPGPWDQAARKQYFDRVTTGVSRRLLTARECLALPVPSPPDWLKDPWPREKFAGWLEQCL